MEQAITLNVNGQTRRLNINPETPLIYALRNDLGLKGTRLGCGQEQCGACHVIIDGAAVPSCEITVKAVEGLEITTIEGLGTPENLHPLQEAFIEQQAAQCGYCTTGIIMTAQGLLNRRRYPTDDEIREALAGNLCRCGTHDRVRRAIKMRIGRWEDPPYEVRQGDPLADGDRLDQPMQPRSFGGPPSLDSWLKINTDGTLTLLSGRVEYGQGIMTALAQIAAEELVVSLERIRVVMADTDLTPDEGMTVGSRSLETSGNVIRQVCAEAREFLLSLAFEELEVPRERLEIDDGTIRDPETGRSTTYWDLLGGKPFGAQVTGRAQPRQPEEYRVVGQAAHRLDLLDKVTGTPVYVQDLELPGMAHARVVRPPSARHRLLDVDEDQVAQMAGVVKVVRDGSFLAVIAEREEQAVWAMEALRESAVWEQGEDYPDQERLFADMTEQPATTNLIVNGGPVDGPVPPIEAPPGAAHTLLATYTRPYHMHATIGPSAAAGLMDADGKLTLWIHSQGVFPPRAMIAHVLGIDPESIHVIHTQGSGCYGHNGADDAALDAALVARALPGRPVLLKWTRADENKWEPYGPAMVIQMQGSLDKAGSVIDWNHDVWGYTHLGRGIPIGHVSVMVAAQHLADPFEKPVDQPNMRPQVGNHRNADPLYTFPKRRVVRHFLAESPLRTSAFRSLGAYANTFAIESFMDELAHAAGIDPVEFHLRNLDDPRARAVIKAAAEKAGWNDFERGDGQGQGIAFAQYKNHAGYAAVIVNARVDRESGAIQLTRAVIAADSGQIVNPDGLSNQIEGGFIQSASMTLCEEVTYNREGITSVDWETYPILTFPGVPKIETVLINRPGQPYLGSGEIAQGPTSAAIANAVFDAVGIRLREIPFRPERVKAALQAEASAPAP